MSSKLRRSIWWPGIIIASAIGVGLTMGSDLGSPFRPMIAFWFLLICPGMAVVRLLQIKERLIEFTLAIALSIALDTIVAESMLLAKIWSPQWALYVLIGLSIGGAALQLILASQGSRPHLDTEGDPQTAS